MNKNLEMRNFSIEFRADKESRLICGLAIPVDARSFLLGDLRHLAYNSLTEMQREFTTHSLSPIVTMIEEQCNKKLIMPSKQGKQFVDLDENSILSPDKEKQANYLSTLVKNGIITINEARYQVGLKQIDGANNLIIAYSDINQNTVNKENTIGGTGDTKEDKNNVEQENEQES